MLNIECLIARQSSITFFLIHPVYQEIFAFHFCTWPLTFGLWQAGFSSPLFIEYIELFNILDFEQPDPERHKPTYSCFNFSEIPKFGVRSVRWRLHRVPSNSV